MQRVEIMDWGGLGRPVMVRLGPVWAAGATEGEAMRALATLLRAHASQIETQAGRASGEAALVGAAAAIGAPA